MRYGNVAHRLYTTAAIATALAVLAGPAQASVERVRVRQGPLVLPPYEVRLTTPQTSAVRAPGLDGYLVKMHARVVDRRGRRLPVRRVMLHHVVYKNLGRFLGDRRDAVCGGRGESFYGTGEENGTLRLPPGYGYRVRRGDRWYTGWMLMNHNARIERAFIEYTAWIETSRRLRAVKPYWARATGCRGATDPIFNVPGGRPPGASFVRSHGWRVPVTGRLVAGTSHQHGGSKEILLSQPACGNRTLMASHPLYGLPSHPYYHVLPVLHEPGPIATGSVTTATGIPVRRGERLRVDSLYDNARPHTRVMGIWHLYIDPDPSAPAGCSPLPRDLHNVLPGVPGRRFAPAVTVPLTGLTARGRARTILRPPGPLFRFGATAGVSVTDGAYNRRNLSIPLGGTVRWRFRSRARHDVTLANGPVGFASPWSVRGQSFEHRFDVPGTYRLFCSLHPITMSQVVNVRPGG